MVIVVIICLSLSDKAEKDKSTYVVKDVDQKLKEKLDKLHNRADNY